MRGGGIQNACAEIIGNIVVLGLSIGCGRWCGRVTPPEPTRHIKSHHISQFHHDDNYHISIDIQLLSVT